MSESEHGPPRSLGFRPLQWASPETRETGFFEMYRLAALCLALAAGEDTAVTRPVAFMTFKPAQGSRGENVGCVGTSPADVGPAYYEESYGCSSLDVCKTKCIYNVKCVGIEYSEGDDGRCRVWTRQDGIGGTVPLTNYVCLQYSHNLPAGEYCWSFLRVGGNGGPGTPDKYKCLETAKLGDGRRLLM